MDNKIKLKGPIFLIKGKDITEVLPIAYNDLEKNSKIWIGTDKEKNDIGCICGEVNYKVTSISIKNLTVFIDCIPYTPSKNIYDLIKNLPDNIKFIDCSAIGIKIITCKELKERHVINNTGKNDKDYTLIKSKGNDKKEKICIKSVSYNTIIYREE